MATNKQAALTTILRMHASILHAVFTLIWSWRNGRFSHYKSDEDHFIGMQEEQRVLPIHQSHRWGGCNIDCCWRVVGSFMTETSVAKVSRICKSLPRNVKTLSISWDSLVAFTVVDCSSKTSYGHGHGRWLALAYCAPTFESTRTLIPGPWSPRASCTRGPGTLGPEAI